MIPPVQSSGTAHVTYRRTGNAVAIDALTNGVEDATSIQVHYGIAGINGPMVAELAQDPDNPARWQIEIWAC